MDNNGQNRIVKLCLEEIDQPAHISVCNRSWVTDMIKLLVSDDVIHVVPETYTDLRWENFEMLDSCEEVCRKMAELEITLTPDMLGKLYRYTVLVGVYNDQVVNSIGIKCRTHFSEHGLTAEGLTTYQHNEVSNGNRDEGLVNFSDAHIRDFFLQDIDCVEERYRELIPEMAIQYSGYFAGLGAKFLPLNSTSIEVRVTRQSWEMEYGKFVIAIARALTDKKAKFIIPDVEEYSYVDERKIVPLGYAVLDYLTSHSMEVSTTAVRKLTRFLLELLLKFSEQPNSRHRPWDVGVVKSALANGELTDDDWLLSVIESNVSNKDIAGAFQKSIFQMVGPYFSSVPHLDTAKLIDVFSLLIDRFYELEALGRRYSVNAEGLVKSTVFGAFSRRVLSHTVDD